MPIVLILSSPPTTTYHDTIHESFASYTSNNAFTKSDPMRSVKDSFDTDPGSPLDFLDPEEIIKPKKKDKPSRGAAIPEGISSGFKKASELLRDAEAARFRFESPDHPGIAKDSEPQCTRIKQKSNANPSTKTKDAKARKTKQDPVPNCATSEETDGHTSRFFAPNNELYAQRELENAGIGVNQQVFQETITTNLSSRAPDLASRPTLTASVANVPTSLKTPAPAVGPRNSKKKSTKVDGVVQSITTKDTGSSIPSLDHQLNPLAKDKNPSTGHSVALQDGNNCIDDFRNLVHAYNYREAIDNSSELKTHGSSTTPIVLDDSKKKSRFKRPNLPSTSPRKPVLARTTSPLKKKQLTVTEKAVEEFRPDEVPDSLSLLEYFPPTNASGANALTDIEEVKKPKVKASRRSKKPEKRSSLLPPSAALESLENQKFVFNTSSQLLQHSSSPSHEVADRHIVRSMSEMQREDSFIDLDSLIGSAGLLGFKSTKSLWSAGTRNEDGTLMNASIIDLTETPTRQPLANTSRLLDQPGNVDPVPNLSTGIRNDEDSTRGRSTDIENQSTGLISLVKRSIPTIPRSLGEAATRQRPTSKSPVKKKRKTKDSEVKVVKPEDGFKKVPLIDLKEELKGYGVKPPRSRAKMIELVLECRAHQGQAKPSGQAAERVEHEQSNSVVSAIEKPGPARMTSIEILPNLEIITTHHTQVIPVSSQAKRKLSRLSTAIGESEQDDLPPPSYQAPADQTEDENEGGQDAAETLSAIQRAIALQSSTHTIANPSWKEKIAMYDPIVLEELTSWLNTGGLDAVGFDEEISPTVVRDWCESKSICFIWASEGWRKKRS